MSKTGNFQVAALNETRCPTCGALTNPRWTKCLSCKSTLSVAKEPTQPGTLSETISPTPLGQTAASPNLPPEAFSAEDWRTYFDERAAIAEHDGGLDRANAERQAFKCAVVQYMNAHPEPEGDPNVCHHCRHRLSDTDMLPVLNGPGGHVWLHPKCHQPFMEQRRAKAITELEAMGLQEPSPTSKG